MEPFLADLINNPNIPKWIRYALVAVVSLFILYLRVICAVESPVIWGGVFGVVLCILILVATAYLFREINKN